MDKMRENRLSWFGLIWSCYEERKFRICKNSYGNEC